MPKLVALISDLIQVLVGFSLQAVEEAFFFEFVHAFLKELPRCFVAVLTKAKFSFGLLDKLLVCEDLFSAECLFGNGSVLSWHLLVLLLARRALA